MDDLISRQAAIDALGEEPPVWYDGEDEIAERNQWRRDVTAIKDLPSAQPERTCVNCGRTANNGGWYAECDQFVCSNCGIELQDWRRVERDEDGDITYHEYEFRFCPNCGAKMDEHKKP